MTANQFMFRFGAPSSLWGAALFCALSVAGCAKKPPELSRLELASLPKDLTPLGQVFGGVVELVGARLVSPPQAVKPGGRVEVRLVWRKLGSVPRGFRLFTHVLDEAGERILNLDATGPLRKAEREEPLYPPSVWEEGKLYVDDFAFFVPSSVRTDTIRVVCGVYRGKERLRLPSGSAAEATRATALRLNVALPPPPGAAAVPSLWIPFRRGPIVLDGKLDEEAWATAASTGPFVNVATGRPATSSEVGGRAKLLYDDDALFVAVEVFDEELRGGFDVSQRDPHLWTKDTVELMLDPDGDGDNLDYYEIQVGPQNLVFDSVFDSYNQPRVAPDGPFGHEEWSSQLKSAVTLRGSLDDPASDEGYTVELAIPWSSFDRAKRAPPAPADLWRINLYAIDDSGSASAWSPILGQGNFHKAARFGRARFLTKPPAKP